MLVSTKGRYALRVMLELAQDDSAAYLPLPAIAERQGISEKYLESILSVLSKAGMLDALRGKGGGYRLAKAPEDYSVYDILCLTEGTLAPVACLEAGQNCENAGDCSTYPLWQGLDETVRKYLSGFTLVDVILMLTEGSLAPVTCLESDENTCPRAGHCTTLPMWEKLDAIINDYLDSVSLADLLTQTDGGAL